MADPSDTTGVPVFCPASSPAPPDGPWISTVALFPVLPPAAPDCLGPLEGPQAWFLTLACLGLLRDLVTSTWLCPPRSDPVGLCLIGKDTVCAGVTLASS